MVADQLGETAEDNVLGVQTFYTCFDFHLQHTQKEGGKPQDGKRVTSRIILR